jgi:hypothetical protein
VRTAPLLAASLAACASVLAAAPTAAQEIILREGEDFLNTTFVGDEAEAARLAFYRAEEQLGAKQPKEAGREIVKLLRGEARGLVRYGERMVVPVETAALFFLLRLPEPIRAELAREEATAGGATPPAGLDDSDALRAFALRHPLAAAGAGALLESGVRELLAGEPGSAAADLERLVHWPSAWPGAARNVAAARLLEAQARSGGFANGAISHWPRGADATIARGGAVTRLDEPIAAARPLPEPREDLRGARLRGRVAAAAARVFGESRATPTISGASACATRCRRGAGDGAATRRRALRSCCPARRRPPATVEAGRPARTAHRGRRGGVRAAASTSTSTRSARRRPVLDRSGPPVSRRPPLPHARAPDARARMDWRSASSRGRRRTRDHALFAFDLKRECYVEFAVTSAELARSRAGRVRLLADRRSRAAAGSWSARRARSGRRPSRAARLRREERGAGRPPPARAPPTCRYATGSPTTSSGASSCRPSSCATASPSSAPTSG